MVGGSGEGGGAGSGEAAVRPRAAWVSGRGLDRTTIMAGLDPSTVIAGLRPPTVMAGLDPSTVMAGLDPAIGFQQAQCDGQKLRAVGEAGPRQ